jgi:hypothetical protein
MVGTRMPFIPVSIPGKIAYLLGSNAWIMDQSTGNREPVVTTNDLDGRVFRYPKIVLDCFSQGGRRKKTRSIPCGLPIWTPIL